MKKSYQWPDYSVIPYEGITKIHFNEDSCIRCKLSVVIKFLFVENSLHWTKSVS